MSVIALFVALSASRASGQEDFAPGPTPESSNATATSENDQATLPNAPSASQPVNQRGSFSHRERAAEYRDASFSPYTFVGIALGASIGQWEDEPPEWRQGAKGYVHRFGSGMARHMISQTIRLATAAADGEDPKYHPSQDRGIWKRSWHAIAETFTSQTADSSRMPAYSRIAGIYGAAFVSNLWYPQSRNTTGFALRRGSYALAASVGFHLVEEFFPPQKTNFVHNSKKGRVP